MLRGRVLGLGFSGVAIVGKQLEVDVVLLLRREGNLTYQEIYTAMGELRRVTDRTLNNALSKLDREGKIYSVERWGAHVS